jgi:hypothetical protein
VARLTPQREDASFAAFYLIALATGVMIVSTRGSSVDLMHVLFGSILAVDDASLLLMAGIASLSLLVLAAIRVLSEPSALAIDGDWLYVGSRKGRAVLRFRLPDGTPDAAPFVSGLADNPEYFIRNRN